MEISFGDNVRVLVTSETTAQCVAGKVGSVLGMTTPSVTSVDVIGELNEDYAINVSFEDEEGEFWFAHQLLEFIDHGAGTEIVIDDFKAIRNADGTWDEMTVSKPIKKKWWQFW